jgi:hypothetical protein
MTAIAAVRNLVLKEKNELWSLNTDKEYHEEVAHGQAQDIETIFRKKLPELFPRLDPPAFGVALGSTSGSMLFLMTLFAVLAGKEGLSQAMALLNQFFPTYSVTIWGALQGFLYLFIVGFFTGALAAFLRNAVVFLAAFQRHRKVELRLFRQFLDYF